MACYGNRFRLASLAASLTTAAMTCLHPNAISHPDGDQPSGNPILSSLLLQSSEHLRMHWRSLGLSGDPFLSASDLQPRLQSFNARRLHRILGLIMQLCEDGASCVALDSSHSAVDLRELYDHPAITPPPCWSADVITAAGPIDRLILPRRETGIR